MEEVNAIGTKGLFTLGGLVAVALITSFSLRAYRDYLEIKELKKQLKLNVMFDIKNPDTFLGGQNVHNLIIIGLLAYCCFLKK